MVVRSTSVTLRPVVGLDDDFAGVDAYEHVWVRFADGDPNIRTVCGICRARLEKGWSNTTTGVKVCNTHVSFGHSQCRAA
jgi:hypothetical protein